MSYFVGYMRRSSRLQQKAIAKVNTIESTDASPTAPRVAPLYSPPVPFMWRDQRHGSQNEIIEFPIPDNKSVLAPIVINQIRPGVWRMYVRRLYVYSHISANKFIFSMSQVSTNTDSFPSCAKVTGDLLHDPRCDYSVD